MKRSNRKPAARAAFSLVEVAIAIGVVAIGMLSVVALLPAGMETLRASANETAQARISQEIIARLQGTDWDQTKNLGDFQDQLFYFDRQGNQTLSTAPDSVFTAKLDVAADGPQLPAANNCGLNQNLRAVTVKITSLPGAVGDRFLDPRKFQQLSVLAAKMSR